MKMELKSLCEKTLKIFDINNVEQLGEKLMESSLRCDRRIEEFAELVEYDFSIDWLQKIFQYYQADRKDKMQDYTPKSLAKFVAKLSGDAGHVTDMCAGSGALTIQKWKQNPDAEFELYEFDEKVIPYLLFNLVLRNVKAIVYHSDVLQQTSINVYQVLKGEKFGILKKLNVAEISDKSDVLISNPPYNMKWKHPTFAQIQPRFQRTELPPESNSNYAFILTALQQSDRCVFILPCGVLTTENKQEKEIRKHLVDSNLIDIVIACPDSMFESTNIPTCVLVLDKNKTTATIEMMDMRQKYEIETREQNGQFGGNSHTKRTYKKEIKIFTSEIINDALNCIKERKNITGYCHSATLEDVKARDYILTPARYIETQEKESKHRKYSEIVKDLNRVIEQRNMCKLTVNETLARTLGFDVELYKKDHTQDRELNDLLEKLAGEKIKKNNYFSATKNKNELRFENTSKDEVSSVLMMILNTWKQHIYFLNQEENRYLAELKDALIPELMSRKIEI